MARRHAAARRAARTSWRSSPGSAPSSTATTRRTSPGSSRETVALFGPERCLFGSNFPIEKLWTTYAELIAAFRAAVAPLGPRRRRAIFHDTAARVYRLDRGERSTRAHRRETNHGTRDQDPRLRRHRARIVASSCSAAIAAAPAACRRYGFLILGGAYPVVVDTGYRSNQIMETLGMRGLQFHENMIENQLARHGVRMGDIRYVLHTHLHIDHAGKDDLFPMNTTVVVNRRELEYSVSGLMHPQYPPARHQAPDRPAAHQERAALPRPRDLRPDRDHPGRLLRGGRRPHRRLDERPRRDGGRASPRSAAT